MARPLKFNNCLDLDAQCELYYDSCIYVTDEYGDVTDERRGTPIPLTITGLALFLGTSRETLMNYERRAEFFDTIKKHKLRCENYAETKLYTGKPVGAIFALKNYGWKDKQEVEATAVVSDISGDPTEVARRLAFILRKGAEEN